MIVLKKKTPEKRYGNYFLASEDTDDQSVSFDDVKIIEVDVLKESSEVERDKNGVAIIHLNTSRNTIDEDGLERTPSGTPVIRIYSSKKSSKEKDKEKESNIDNPDTDGNTGEKITAAGEDDATADTPATTTTDTTTTTTTTDADTGATSITDDEGNVTDPTPDDTNEDETNTTTTDTTTTDDTTTEPVTDDNDYSDDTATDATGDTNDVEKKKPGIEYDSTRKFLLFHEFIELETAIDRYLERLDNTPKINNNENRIFRDVIKNLNTIKDLCNDYIKIKFEISSYAQSRTFYQTLHVMVQLTFDNAEKALIEINKKLDKQKK